MADDIAAKITIAIETADAVRSCEQVEEALSRVTKARQDDLSLSQKTTQQTQANADALQKEADALDFSDEGRARHRKKLQEEYEAARKLAEARRELEKTTPKKSSAEKGISAEEARRQVGLPDLSAQDEARITARQREILEAENKRIEESFKKRAKSVSESKREEFLANKQAQQEAGERRLAQRTEDEERIIALMKERSALSAQELQKEIAQNEVLVAKKRLQIATEKELMLLQKKKLIEQNLAAAEGAGDATGVFGASIALEELNKELAETQKKSLSATAGLASAQKTLANIGDTTAETAKKGGILIRSLQAIGRAMGLPVGVRAPGRGASKEETALMTGMAGVAAFSAVINLWRGVTDLIAKERAAERTRWDFNQGELSNSFSKISSENKNQEALFNNLKEYNFLLDDSALSQVKLKHSIEKVTQSLGGFALKLDSSGRVQNFFSAKLKADTSAIDKELSNLRSQERNYTGQLDYINSVVGQRTQQAPTYLTYGLRKIGANTAAMRIEDFEANVKDRVTGRMQEVEKAEADILRITQERAKILEQIREKEKQRAGIEQELVRQIEEIRAQLADDIKNSKNIINASRENFFKYQDVRKWQKNKDTEYKAQYDSNENRLAEIEFEIEKTKGTDLPSKEKLLELERESARIMRENAQIKQYLYQRKIDKINVDRTIKDIEEEKNQLIREVDLGMTKRQVYEQSLFHQREKLEKQQGWSEGAAQKWMQIQMQKYDLQQKKESKKVDAEFYSKIAQNQFQYRATAQDVVYANSIEAVHLQSRMLTGKTQQQQLLDVNRQQATTLKQIESNTKANKTQGVTV